MFEKRESLKFSMAPKTKLSEVSLGNITFKFGYFKSCRAIFKFFELVCFQPWPLKNTKLKLVFKLGFGDRSYQHYGLLFQSWPQKPWWFNVLDGDCDIFYLHFLSIYIWIYSLDHFASDFEINVCKYHWNQIPLEKFHASKFFIF